MSATPRALVVTGSRGFRDEVAAEIERYITELGLRLPVRVGDAAADHPNELVIQAGAADAAIGERHKALEIAVPNRQGWEDALRSQLVVQLWLGHPGSVVLAYVDEDARGVADGLHADLSSPGFRVVRHDLAAAPSDEEADGLAWALNDADLLLVLGSPCVPDDGKTQAVLAAARNAFVGTLAVVWPQDAFDSKLGVLGSLTADQKLELSPLDLSHADAEHRRTLDLLARQRILRRALDLRARAVLERFRSLRALAEREHGDARRSEERLGDLHIDGTLLRLAPHRPEPHELFALEADDPAGRTWLLEASPWHPRSRALRWLANPPDCTRVVAPLGRRRLSEPGRPRASRPKNERWDRTDSDDEVAAQLRDRRCVFLSASVPYIRHDDRDDRTAKCHEFTRTARPDRIRDAVAWLCRYAFAEDLALVFGGHPAISPMVLAAARALSQADQPAVFVFQSAWFRDKIPPQTLELTDWTSGYLLWTEKRATKGDSLEHMRRRMLQLARGCIGGVFIGGMEGVVAEHELFGQVHRDVPRFVLPSTGGATLELGDHVSDDELATVFHDIFDRISPRADR